MKTLMGLDDRRAALRAAARIGLIYGLVGTLWIVFSDAVVESISRDPDWLLGAQRYKGLVYVVLTTVGLVWLVHLGYARLLASERRAARSDLQARDLFDHHPQPMWVVEPRTWRFLRVNDAAVAAYGYGSDEFLAMTAEDIHPPNDRASFLAAARRSSVGNGSPGVFRHRRKDGSTLLARISEHRVELHGRPALMVMAEDVTEEVGLQDAVHRQQRQFQQLHESLGEVLWMASPDFRQVVHVSPAFETLYGRKASDLIANPRVWLDAVHPDDVDHVADLSALPPGQDSVQSEYRIVRPDGSVRWIEDRKRLIRDAAGDVVLVGGIAEDVTARKERDEAREALAHRLEALVAERTAELQQANIELEAFSRTAAHDLKSPLNGIVGMSGLLRLKAAHKLDENEQRYLALIERSSRDMATLINDLLTLSRAGSVELQRATVDLAPIVHAQLDQLRTLEPLRNVEVDMPDRLEMYCDEGLMHSVLHNLLNNAWKFTGTQDPACITLTLQCDDEASTLTVADNGAGFDTSGLDDLMRPFQRFHTQAQFQGTGLGLVTCQRIVQRHGGRLSVTSRPGQGTRVAVRLPAAPPDAAAQVDDHRPHATT
jgi:PAS domain S-box-containing protein